MNSKSIEKPLPTKFSKFTAEFPEKTDFFYIVDGNLKICCYSVESYKIFKKKVDNIRYEYFKFKPVRQFFSKRN